MSISRRKISTTEDFLKSLSDQIREEKIARGGTDSDAAKILSYVRLIPETIYISDTLTTGVGVNSLTESISSSDVSISFVSTKGSTDHISFGNDAYLIGTTLTDGKYRGGVSFNGSSAFARISDSNSLDLTTSVTLSAWVYLNSAQQGIMIEKPNSFFLSTNANGNRLYAGVRTGSGGAFDPAFSGAFDESDMSWGYITGSTALALATWYHAVVTYNGTNINLYLNGQSDATAVSKTDVIAFDQENVTLGYNAPNTQYYLSGILDEARIYNRALTSTEISRAYSGIVTRDGIVLELSCNETSGSSLQDSSGARIGYSEIQ